MASWSLAVLRVGDFPDVSLFAADGLEKIRENDHGTDQEIANLIPAKQLDIYKACRAARASADPGNELGSCCGYIGPAETKNSPALSDAAIHPTTTDH